MFAWFFDWLFKHFIDSNLMRKLNEERDRETIRRYGRKHPSIPRK